jgi:hypothetical protein
MIALNSQADCVHRQQSTILAPVFSDSGDSGDSGDRGDSFDAFPLGLLI